MQFTSDYNLASGHGGVDRTWYLQTYPDVATARQDPVEHYLRHGWQERRDPRPDFSTSGYLEANKGVEGNPFVHYLRYGGITVPSEWQLAADYKLASLDRGVDRTWYLQKYGDVARAGIDPVEHYLRYGWREGRDPRPDFSTSGYFGANKDVEGNPLVHYLRLGGIKVPTPEWQFAADYKPAGRDRGVERTRYLETAETSVTDWYLLWKEGFLHPKGGQEPSPNAAFGSQGVPKILFTGHDASRTGAPLILLRLMQAIQDLTGAELYLILEKGERGGPLLDDYKRIAHVLLNHNGMLYQPDGPNLERMLRSIADPAPELAICNSADGWRLLGALREAGLQHLVTLVHERFVHYPPDVWRLIHQRSSRVIFPAHAVKAAVTVALPEFWDTYVIPQGLLRPEFGHGDRNAARIAVRNRLGLSADTTIVFSCGTQDMRKGLDLFVQLAARVRARTTRDVHFVWLGAEQRGTLFSKLIALDISVLNLSSTVSLLGGVADPEQYFLAADAFALTSRDDPFPCVIHEAMACALPIVAFDGSGGAKEAISGGCGIVVPYLNIEAMARSLTSVIEDPLQHAGMAQSAELRVRSVYAFSEYAERIWEICEVVMGKRALYQGRDNCGLIAPHKGEHFGEDARFASEEKWPEIARTFQVRRAEMKDWIWALPGSVARTIRTGQWWYHKLVPIYSVFYATAYVQHVSVASIWSAAVALLLAIVPCAAYVSLVNDLTDRADDRHAGKFNRMAGRPVWQMTVLVTAPLCAAVFFILLWRDDILLVGAYLCSWVAFSVYSLPPFRLKSRGVLGVIADACGSHVFPALVAALLARRATGGPIDQVWTAAVAAWALGYGLRGILWHQLYDFEADRKAGVQTFVLTHSARAAVGFARLALVIEIAGLAIVLWQIKSPLPPFFLLIYTLFAILKSRIWNVAIVIAEPCDRYSILGTEYYTLLFPFALLLSSALQYPADWVVLIAHSIVFRQPAVLFFREMRQLLLDIARAQRRSRMHQSGP